MRMNVCSRVIAKLISDKGYLFSVATLLFVVVMLATSCNKDRLSSDPSLKLSFSTDTVSFDTVFTTLHSSYRILKVYNRNNSAVNISSIKLASGGGSYYKLNIDGVPSGDVSNIELKANDSLFVFVRITIDPTSANTPFIVEDDLNFMTNGNEQTVKLFSYGQNANFFKVPDGQRYYIIGDSENPVDTTWTNNGRPFVIWGWLAIEEFSTLRIEKGCNIYFHGNSGLLVYTDATLKVNGTVDEPVTFRNDRFEPFYRNLPGQWEGLWFYEGSVNNEVNHAIIENGKLAIQTDMFSVKNPSASNLKISNTIMRNLEIGGLACNGSVVSGYNLQISGCGSYAMALNAGEYDFKQVSIGNYGGESIQNRETTSLHISNAFIKYDSELGGNVQMLMDSKVFFGNSIIAGGKDEEISLGAVSDVKMDYVFDHCLLKTKVDVSKNPNSYIGVIVDKKNPFVDAFKFNLNLVKDSQAIGKGVPMGIDYDCDGRPMNNPPDLGALQYKEVSKP